MTCFDDERLSPAQQFNTDDSACNERRESPMQIKTDIVTSHFTASIASWICRMRGGVDLSFGWPTSALESSRNTPPSHLIILMRLQLYIDN